MRRTDREVTDERAIDAIIEECNRICIGFYDGKEVYVLPLSFGYERENGKQFFYFHSAKEGKKISLVKNFSQVGFELDCGYEVLPGESACSYSAKYKSIIGNGKLSFIEGENEKLMALEMIMEHNTGKSGWAFEQGAANAVSVIRLEVESLSAKVHE